MTDSLSKMEQSIIVESPLVMHFGNRPVSYSRISILDSQYSSSVGKGAGWLEMVCRERSGRNIYLHLLVAQHK